MNDRLRSPSTDPLREYRAKRDFKVTGEPSGQGAKGADGARHFMVHKHDATRLHYDLRFEIDGVLASWSCPKGPSYDPGQKRLAVETEDHPLEYGDFEGRIPDGQYGAGDTLIWDRGSYETVPKGHEREQRLKGHLHLKLEGEKLRGEWHLVRTRFEGGKPQWLIFKAKDGTERAGYEVVQERPESVVSGRRITRGPTRKKALHAVHPSAEGLLEKVWPPMLAVLSQAGEAPSSEYFYEVKYDGFRALVALSGGKLEVRSRNKLDLVPRFPFVQGVFDKLVVGEAVLDGEIVGLDQRGVSGFERLGDASAEHRVVLFDLLWLEGEDLRPRPIEERRELLESLLSNADPRLMLAERVAGDEGQALAEATRRGLEGVIAKRRGSAYEGVRSPSWKKLKVQGTAELVVVGYTPHSSGKKLIGALLLAAREGERLVYAGKVGTGFDEKTRKALFALLGEIEVKKPEVDGAPKLREAHWVSPKHLAQLRFSEWTHDRKLRHPVFQGLRDDKNAGETQIEPPTSPSAAESKPSESKVAMFGGRDPGHFGVWHSNRESTVAAPSIEVPRTHAERVIFPALKITKGELRDYYDAVAPLIVKAMRGRPLAMQQWPQGITGQNFFRLDAGYAPEWISRTSVEHEGRVVEQIVIDRVETVSWLANQSAITLHMTPSRVGSLSSPDWVAFDFDPPDGSWEKLAPLAHTLRGLLEELKLKSVVKSSGKRGVHVFVPLAAGHTFEHSAGFARSVCALLAQKFPALATVERMKKNRHGLMYLDAGQNAQVKTMVAPYSVRAVESAGVSTPLQWDEVHPRFDPAQFNLRTVGKRLSQVGDLFAVALSTPQRLPELHAAKES